MLYVGVFLISVATLLLEVLQTRILAFMLWPSLVYVVVTFAMLGFGMSGAALSIFPPMRWPRPRRTFGLFSLAFSVTAVLGVIMVGRFPIPALHFTEKMRYPIALVGYYFLLTVPYFFSGLCICSVFTVQTHRVNKLYFANLVGSGVGCVLLVVVISKLGGEGTLFLTAAIGLLAACAFAAGQSRGLVKAYAVLTAVSLVCGLLWADKIVVLRCDPTKELGQLTHPKIGRAGRIEHTGWSPISRTDVISSPTLVDKSVLGKPWPFKMITADGAAWTPMLKGVDEKTLAQAREKFSVYNGFRMLPYVTKHRPETLIIGPGGGPDVIAARIRNASHITGADINPVTVHAVKEVFNDYVLGLYSQPGIDVHVAEGRNFVTHSAKQYDVIHIHAVDTITALASGSYVAAENYLYTAEAMIEYLEHLKDDGVLAINRVTFDVPRETIKVCTAMIEAFDRLGLGDLSRHSMIIGDPSGSQWTSFLCKRSPWTPEELKAYDDIFQRIPFRVYYKPGMTLSPDFDSPFKPARHFVGLFDAYREGRVDEFYGDYPYDISPITDDRPFFFKIHKMSDFFHPTRPVSQYEGRFGLIALLILLAQTIVISALLIVVPLLKFQREGLRAPNRLKFLIYFAGLGLGFMFIELPLMQKLSLFLGHPTYSISVVLFSLLLFSGLGSLAAGRVRLSLHTLAATSIAVIVVVVLAYARIVPSVTQAALGLPLAMRVLVAIALLAPLSFCMGMPFPTGLKLVESEHARFVPWAWGANGVASVLGTVMSIFLSMSVGFNVVLRTAAVAYAIAAITILVIRLQAAPLRKSWNSRS